MRIILALHQYLPHFCGGTENLAGGLAHELGERGHQVRVICGHPRSGGDESRLDEMVEGIQVTRLISPLAGESILLDVDFPRVAGLVTQIALEWKADLIHFLHFRMLSASAASACAKEGLPVLWTPTDFWFRCPTIQGILPDGTPCSGPDSTGINCLRHLAEMKGILPARLVRIFPLWLIQACVRAVQLLGRRSGGWVQCFRDLNGRQDRIRDHLRQISLILPPTQTMIREITRFGLDPARIEEVPFASVPSMAPDGQPRGTFPVLRLGFIGHLIPGKGLHVVLEALKGEAMESGFTLDIYGSLEAHPPYSRRLQRLIGGKRHIRFRGTFPPTQLAQVLSNLDLLLAPSIWEENSPLTVLSARSVGCPVVASDVSGLAAIVTAGRDGWLVPANNIGAWRQALTELIRRPELVRQTAVTVSSPRTLSDLTQQVEQAYVRLLGRDMTR
jgi:glycosyltransferase involved in cell wall biosynthesis